MELIEISFSASATAYHSLYEGFLEWPHDTAIDRDEPGTGPNEHSAPSPAHAARHPTPPEQHTPQASAGSGEFPEIVDLWLHAIAARYTLGLSPAALAEAYTDWMVHLASSPGKQMQLAGKLTEQATALARHAAECTLRGGTGSACIEPLPQDRRFAGASWQKWPYQFLDESFLTQQQWWHYATTGVRGVTQQHENVVEFAARQILDMVSPSNFIMTNPELLERTIAEGGILYAARKTSSRIGSAPSRARSPSEQSTSKSASTLPPRRAR